MRGMSIWAASAAVLACAATAHADSPRLKGEYAFTGTAACLHAPLGFDEFLRPLRFKDGSGQAYAHSFSVMGIRVFNGDGTGTATATQVSILPPPTPSGVSPNASGSTFSFSFTYTVSPDGTLNTALVPGSFSGTFTAGPRTGDTFTLDKLPMTGLIANEGKSIVLASVEPTVETITFNSKIKGDSEQRICHRSRVLVKMDNDRDGDRDGGRDRR